MSLRTPSSWIHEIARTIAGFGLALAVFAPPVASAAPPRPIEGEIIVKFKPGMAAMERAAAREVVGNGTRRLKSFDFVRAGSLEEALAALREGGDDAKPIAGGQSLVPALNMRLVRPSLLVDLNGAGLGEVAANGSLRIGATVRQAALAGDERVHPLVRRALPFVGHVVTRNRGTVGGSIAHADGAAEHL